MSEKNQDQNERTMTVPQLRAMQTMEKRKMKEWLRRRRSAENMLVENRTVYESIVALKGKEDMKSIIPLGAGVFVEGNVKPTTFKRMLPGNVLISANADEVEKELDERKALLEKEMGVADKEIQGISANLTGIGKILQTVQEMRAKDRAKK